MRELEKKESAMKYKLIYTSLVLFVYILGRCIPLYGIDIAAYSSDWIDAENMLLRSVGGDAYRISVFAIGLSPCITSSILIQIIMAFRNSFTNTKISPGKISRVTVVLTLIIAFLQAVVRISELNFLKTENGFFIVKIIAAMEMVTGVMVILWLSDRNAKYGIGGRTMLIVVNILDGLVSTISVHRLQNLIVPFIVSAVLVIIVMVLENTEKHIPVQRISIHNIYADKNYMAIKLNPVGVMPVMFSAALFMLPQMLVSLLGYLYPENPDIIWWQVNLSLRRPLGIAIYVIGIYALTVLFSVAFISPKDITEQFLKSGDSIVDIHAGHDTRKYLREGVFRISVFSATIMSICVGTPMVLQLRGNIESTLMMLPSSIMMLAGLWCNIYRETITIRNYDSYRALF